MFERSSTGAFVLAVLLAFALMVTMSGAQAADDAKDPNKYPNWKGQWSRINTNNQGQAVKFDPTKPSGLGQQAPLTPEYQKIHEDSMADQAQGGQGLFADHAAWFFAGEGHDPARGLALARQNAASRKTERAFEVLLVAAIAARDKAAECRAASEATSLPYASESFRSLVARSTRGCANRR